MDYSEFWDRINRLIKETGRTQPSLSAECGFSERRINNLSAANRSPSVDEAVKIASALGTTVEYLATGSHPPTKPDTSALLRTLSLAMEQASSL